ncbi:MAG: tetratricopeptide repeat protein [Christensenella sp.]|nr:tetratricopeptide repeat protein [Christensenella sp.]
MENTTAQFFEELDKLYAAGKMEDVEQFLLASGRRYAPCCGGFNPTYLAVLSELGGFYRGTSRYRASLNSFEAAQDVIGRFLGTDTVEYATNLNNMAGTCRLMGEYEKSLGLFQKALDIYESTVSAESYLYASALNNMALLYQSMEDYKEAAACLEKALGIIKTLPDCEEEAATSYTNLAALYQKMGQKAKAAENLEMALSIFKGNDASPHYAAALNIRAGLQFNAGEYSAAADTYLETLAQTNRFFGHNIEYGIACENLAHTYEKSGQLDLAAEYMVKAKDIFEAVRGKDHPSSQKAIDALREMEERRNTCSL